MLLAQSKYPLKVIFKFLMCCHLDVKNLLLPKAGTSRCHGAANGLTVSCRKIIIFRLNKSKLTRIMVILSCNYLSASFISY